MGVNSLPRTVTRQRRGCDLNPGPSAPESSTLTTRLPSHHAHIHVYRSINRFPLKVGTKLQLQCKEQHTSLQVTTEPYYICQTRVQQID